MMAYSTKSAPALDAAFADFASMEAADSSTLDCNAVPTGDAPTLAATLIASIAAQLEALDSQRRQLERLLCSADATV